MKNSIMSAICDGLSTTLVAVESEFTRGFAGIQVIGNPSEVCRDGKERAKTALEKLGFQIPNKRLIISLSPGDQRKDGNHFDLPIAVSMATLLRDHPPAQDPARWLFAAELGLSGELKPVKGIVSLALTALAEGFTGIVVAAENRRDIEALNNLSHGGRSLELAGFRHLRDVLAWFFQGINADIPSQHDLPTLAPSTLGPDFDDMLLTPELEQTALICAGGLHNVLLRGTPGSGKSMFAMRLPAIFPPMGDQEHLEAMQIQSTLTERLPTSLLAGRPPFRHPHHQASAAALMGTPEAPGEISLAHGGILFLDELPEFRRDLLEALREPMESGEVQISRSRRRAAWRSRCLIVAACNNCPCGWLGSERRECFCGTQKIMQYQQKLSGPVLDRIDLHVRVVPPPQGLSHLFHQLAQGDMAGKTAAMREQVQELRERSHHRNRRFGVRYNRDIPTRSMVEASGLPERDFIVMLERFGQQGASHRAAVKTLRVARTLADLRGAIKIGDEDMERAWMYQPGIQEACVT